MTDLSAIGSNSMQAFTGCQTIWPACNRPTKIVQAPQSPSAQPSFVPVSYADRAAIAVGLYQA